MSELRDRIADELGIQNADDVMEILTAHGVVELESIVRDLAVSEPYVRMDDDGVVLDRGGKPFACAVCGMIFVTTPSPAQHDPACPHRRAVEWVAAHPEGDSE